MDYYGAMAEELKAPGTLAAALRHLYKSEVDKGNGERLVPQLIDLLGRPDSTS